MEDKFIGGVYVSCAYFSMYYGLIVLQTVIKHKMIAFYKTKGKHFQRYYNFQDKPMLGGDRAVGNTLEQMGPFLTFFWLNLALRDDLSGVWNSISLLGMTYVILRCLFPIVWLGVNGGSRIGPKTNILFITIPGYAIIISLTISLFGACR